MINYTLDLDYLRTFQAVAELGSMHRAAEARHMTQPAVTRQMAILSREVGVPLFRRFGRGVRLTEAGEALLKESRLVFRTVEEGLRRVREVEERERLTVSLGSSHYVASTGLAIPVRDFRKAHPEVRLDFVCGSSEAMAERVREGSLDLAVATLPGRSEGLRQIRLWTDTFVAAIPAEFPLADQKGVTLEDLAAGTLLLPPFGSTTRLLIDRVLRRREIRPARVIELETLESIAAGVAMTLGTAILPVRLLFPGSPHASLVVSRPIEGFDESRDLGILVRRGRPLAPRETALISCLERELGEGRPAPPLP